MELTAQGCRAARTVHEPVPIQTQGSLVSEWPKPYLDRFAQSRWGSVPASSSGPTDPFLRANLFPKLRMRLADFPYLHCSIDQRLFTLETCCGYGIDLRRGSTLVPRIFKGRPVQHRTLLQTQLSTGPRCLSPIQSVSGKPALYKDAGLRPASLGSIASQLWPSRGGELRLQVREYWPNSLSTRGRTPARGRPAPPLGAELP